jgi:hypothetical protein
LIIHRTIVSVYFYVCSKDFDQIVNILLNIANVLLAYLSWIIPNVFCMFFGIIGNISILFLNLASILSAFKYWSGI